MSKKKLIINIVIILIVTGLSIYTLLASGTLSWEECELGNFKWWKALIILGSVAFYIVGETFVIFWMFKINKTKVPFRDCMGTYLYANLGTNITPAKTGHHPFRLFFLERRGVSFAQGFANATQCQIVYTIVQVFLYGAMTVGCAVFKMEVTINSITVPMYLVGLVGIGLALFASAFLVSLAFIPPIRKLIVKILAWFNVKMKKVQTKEEYEKAQEEKMRILREEIIKMFTKFYRIIPALIVYAALMVVNNCLPYIIYCLIADHAFAFGELCLFFSLYQAINYISNIVPIPGNAGGAEWLFSQLYKGVCGIYTGTVVLLWRLFSYYLPLIVEMVYFISSSVAMDAKKEMKLHKILSETTKGWTPKVHSHFDTMEMELLSVNFKDTPCYNCCHLQNNLFKCDKYQDKPDDILKNKIKCPHYEERNNGEDL